LGGVDVARKALILGRMLGMEMEIKDVSVEPLYPESLAKVSVDGFMKSLDTLDKSFEEKDKKAQADGNVLRYVADVDNVNKKLAVGLKAVPKSSPLGSLDGADNMVEFHTKYYGNPVVLQGAGAGLDCTASGVLSDVIDICHSFA
jgi:homoserine dehydrogenase